jgi:hypothetical protein
MSTSPPVDSKHETAPASDAALIARSRTETAFKVKAFETNRWMLWDKPRSTWAWTLTPLQGGRTRLVVRIKDRYDWRHSPGNALLSLVLFELGDFPMMRRLLQGVKARAEHPRAYGPPTLVDDAHARVR